MSWRNEWSTDFEKIIKELEKENDQAYKDVVGVNEALEKLIKKQKGE